MKTKGGPRASWTNKLASSPLIVAGVDADGTNTGPATGANQATATLAPNLMGVGPLIWDSVSATWGRQTSARGFNADNLAGTVLPVAATWNYNETGYDRQRNNTQSTLLASAARTSTTNTADQTLFNGRGAVLFLDITVVPGVETVTLAVQIKDPASGKYISILTSAPQATTGTTIYAVYPGVTPAGGIAISFQLTHTWRVLLTHSASGSFTYSLGGAVTL